MAPVRCPQLESLLPASCVVVSSCEDIAAPLFPVERRAIIHAVEGRRREFITARACAREALAGLGLPDQAIPVRADGDPQWPPGVVGSITHCRGFRAAAVAPRAKVSGIGIDAEPNTRLPPGVLDAVSLPEERSSLRSRSAANPAISWGRLLFSVKEAVFKAWFPFARRRLGFEDARVIFDRERPRFSVWLRTAGDLELPAWRGRWIADDGLLLSAIALSDGARHSS
jgi:4'-phosphopantetheinyl transferase EntD